MPEDTLASFGSSKRFECRVIGYPTPRITWLKDDMNITKSDRYKFEFSVDGYVTMEIENVTYADVGSYQCLAVNSEGWASTTALLKVKGTDTDKTDDTLTVHRMTFDQSGSRKDSNKRPLVLANIDKTEGLDDFLSMDHIDRSLSANGIRQISMKVISTGIATVEDVKRNISFPGSDPNEIDMSDDSFTNNHTMLETDNLDGNVIAGNGKAQDVDLAETDSGHFSSSSSIKQQNENKGSKITISIDEVSDDEDVQAGLEDTVEELASFLKADDEFNRARRLTGDSGIADDDYSPPSSDEDLDHMRDRRRSSRKYSDQHNKKRAKKSPSCDDPLDDTFIRREVNDQELESTKNIPNDKVSPSGRNGDRFDNKTSSSTSKKEDQNSIISDVDQPSNYINKGRYPGVDDKAGTDCKPAQICENKNEVENFVQSPKTSHISDRLKDGITNHQLKQKPNAIEEQNTQFDAENINSEDEGEDNFHSDEEEHRILAEIRPNLHLKKQLFDDSTSNAFSAESWSVYDSGHDCTLSESNFDALSYQHVDISDDSKLARNGIRDSMGKDEMCDSAGKDEMCESAGKDDICDAGKDEMCDSAGKDEMYESAGKDDSCDAGKDDICDAGKDDMCESAGKDDICDAGKDEMCDSAGRDEICESGGKDEMYESAGKDDICDAGKADITAKDRLDNQTAQNLSCDDKINALGYEKLDLLPETDSSDIEKAIIVEKTFENPKDITFVKSDENTGEDVVDLANDNGSNDGEHLFHSDEEEQQILAEIRPNLHLKKPMLDETRSNTLSLQSAESWSMYESGDDYSLSETNLDALSYQDIDDENFFLCKFGEKSSNIGDLKTINHIEDIQNGEESSLIQENEIKEEDSHQSYKTKEKESNDEGINSELVSDFDNEKSLNKDKGIGISTEIDICKSPTKDVIGALVSDIDFDESHNKDTRIGILTDFDNDKFPTKDIIGELVSDIDDKKSLNKDKDIGISTEIENDKSPTKDEISELVSDIDINESPDKDKSIDISTEIDIAKSPTKDEIGELISDIDNDESPNKDKRIGILTDFDNDKSPTNDVISEFVSDIDIEEFLNKDLKTGISTEIDIDKYPTKDVIGDLVSDIDIDESPNKDNGFGILTGFDNDKSPIKNVIGELVSDIYIDESHKNDKSSAILSDIETDTTNIKDEIDCLVVDIDVNESPNKERVGVLLVDVAIDKSLSNQDNKMKILTDIDIIESVDSDDKMDDILSNNDIDNNQYQGSDTLKKNCPLLDKSKDIPANRSALDDDQRQVEQSNKILQDYNEKFRSLGEKENDKKQGEPNENEESDLLTVDLRDTPYSSDEYIDDESDVSVEEIEEERCDILKQLDLSSYVINEALRKQQLTIVEENTSPELSDDNDDKVFVSDTLMNSKIKAEETNKNSTNDNQISKDKVIMNDTSVYEKQGITSDDKEFEKRHGTKTLQQLHSISSSDEIYDESIGLESLSDTRPALPNTLFIGDNQSLASLMGRIAAETNTQQNESPPELEDMDFTDFVNILAVVPGKDARILLSPISEEGTISQVAESIDSISPESVEERQTKKPKRPSVIDLTVTDTDGIVERINLQNIDVLQSFSKPCSFDQPIETGMEQIPRIVKGPSSITAVDSEEIILQWTITGFPEPEVVIFKDGETLDICDGITLENDQNTWTLQIPYGMKEDAGLYEICAVNSSGNDILKTRVYVKNAKNSPVREDEFNNDEREEQIGVPEFLKSPSNVEVKEGDIIHVECQITGDPSPQIVWFKNGELFYPEERVEILQDSTKCQLIIQQTEPEDAGIYMCRASNSVGVNQVQFTVCVTDQGDNIQTATDINNDEDSAKWNLVPGHDKAEWNTVSSHDRLDKPTAPVIQLDMSESDECFSRRYKVASDYHDAFNDIDLQKGEIIEVLDRSKESHWLVKSMQEQTKVCYAPPDLLVDTDVDNVGNVPAWNQGQGRNPVSKEEIQTKTKKVLVDLLESETDYICDLKDLIDTYSQSLEKGKVSDRKSLKEGKISNKKPVADKQDKILEDLSKLYQFHKETLLPSLLKTQDDAEIVGDLFTERRGSFCEYVPFVSDHDKAMDDTDPDQLAALMEAFSLILGDPANAFEDLMNRPLERIHEYIELLKTLIKLTAQSGGDCSGLMAAVQMLTEICRTMEDIVLLDKIEGYHGDVKQLGPVLKHEDVKVKVDKDSVSEGQRHVILFQDKIMVTKPMTSDPKGKLEFEKIIELKDLTVGKQEETDGSSSCTIELWEDKSLELSASPSLKLQVQDIHAKQAWVRDIREAKKKLELQEETLTMPEFKQKLKGKNLTSTPKKSKLVKNIDSVEVESDRSSDDFNILGTTRKDLVGDRYVAAEFEDGTTRPVFKRKLQKTIVEESSTAKLECEVAGIPQPKVLWLKNNRPLFESDHCKVISDGATHTLEFTDIRKGDTGLYTARAMNVNGSTISTAELYVGEVQPALLNKYKEGLSDSKYQTPAYFFQMNSCQVEEGRLARFDCRVVAYPKPEIVWMKDGKVVEPNDRYKLLNFNNEIYSLLIQNVVKEDMGRYTCWAHNKYGEAMTEAYLNVIAFHDQQEEGDISPQFLTRFYDQTLTEGVPAELQCLIDGRPFPTIKWLFNDCEIIPNDNVHILQEKNLIGLCIKEVTSNDLGTYTCNLKNALGEAKCSAGLNVLSEKIKNVPVLPKFLRKLSDQNVRTGEGVTFEVVVIGEPPPKVTWLFNHKPISETRRRFKISQDSDVYRLTIEDLILDDDGKITCKAVNSEGEVYSSGNLLVRESRKGSEKPEEPKFTQKDFDAKYGYLPTFIKKIEDTSIPTGKDGKFECRVMGIPEPTVTWKKDGRNLTNDGHYLISQDGGTCYLTIRGAKDRDQGLYTCIVANAAGENTCTAYMKLTEALKPGEHFDRESSLTPLIRKGTGEVPTMPYEKPTISDIRPESTRLTWQPVLTSALSPDSKNIKYLIEGRELPDADWRKLASGIHGNTHLLRNLRPQRDYDFRVRAENQFGVSDATTPAMLERPRTEVDDFADSMKSKVPQFRRPPELPKSKPLIADFGTDSVKLAWQPAYVPPAIKTAPPVSYRLEAQELPATDWLPLSSRLTDTSHYLSDLLSDRDYNIRVRAENKYGLSEPTDSIWIPRAKAFPGVPISRPEITEMEPHMVKLRWERVDVPSFSANDKELMYMIEMQAPPVRDWSTVARDIPGTVYVVSDLEPGQDYKFRVRARTPLGKMSEPSPVTSVYRTVATSMAPIDSFELEDQDVDFDGIRLKWNRVEIPPYGADEQPLLYMIEMNEPPLDEWRPIVSGLPTTRYRVTDLVPDRDYHFRVRALSSYGVSPPSYTLPVSYRRPLPGPSRVLSEYPQIVYDESDALQLAWQPPKISSHEPIRYRVELQAPPSLAWKPLATGISDTRYPIRGLGPSRDYMFRVVPETRAGTLEPLPPVSLTSLPAPRTFLPSRPEILDYKPDSFMLSWRRPYVDTHLPVMYRIEMQEPPSVDWRPLVSDVADTRYHVTGLQPSRDYSFRIVPYSGSDYWEPLPPVTLTSMPIKPRFRPHEPTITPFGDDSIKLSWKPADIPMYQRTPVPIRYIVDMRTLPSYDWTPLTRNILDTSYIVKGLSPLKEYQFRVRPQTDYGIGEPTMPVTFYRKPVPMLRREPIISNIYGDSVLLSWQPAEIQGDFKFPPKVTYSIELQDRPGVGPWTPFLTGITGTNYQVTGLRPDREYFFRVRGHVGDVFGEPSAPVYLTHRAGPPKMPNEQPYISEMNPNSVHLQWRAVQLPSKITDYAPVTYRLEVQELPRSDWVILVDGIPHTDFHVTNLHPDREYNFRVRAINKYGYSEPTPLVQIRRRAVPPRMPKDEPMIYDIGHGSLMLSWRPADVPHYLSESPVTYTIYVQEPHSTTWRPLFRRIPYTSYHVTNLNPDRDYCFRVQAENQYGVSQPTNTIRLTRLSDFRSPIDIPEISEFDDTRSSLMLRWKPKQMAPFAGKPLKYHIESWEPVKRTWRSLARDIPDTSYRLTGLSPENDYILRVRAQAESALSEPSYPISTSRYRTKTPITRPQLFDVDSDSVRLSWQPYAGTITPRRYRLELRESSVPDWRPVTTDIYGTTHKVTGLKPKQDYEFRVRGITEKGPTDYVYSVPLHRRSVIPRMPLAGVDVVNVDDDYVDLSWRMVDIPAYSADDKPLAFLIEAQQLPRYDWLPVASGISDTSYRVKNLQRNQDYNFRIRGEYPSGLSQPSQHVPVYRRPIRPGVPITRPEIIDEDSTSARLRWQRVYTPPYRHSEPISYQIEQQEAPHRNWRPLARGITMTEHTITDLMPKKDYLFRIRAESQNGDISAPTPPISYYKSPTNEVDIENKNVDLNNLPIKLENEIFTNLREYDDCLDSNKNGICVKDDLRTNNSLDLENTKSVTSHDTDNQNNNEASETNMKEDKVKHNDDPELSHDYSCNTYKNEIDDSDTDENDFEAPSPRIPRKTVDYKMFEQDFSVPSRCYVDHLTTFIPPRLPLDKPDMTEDGPSTVSLRWRPAQVPERTRDKYPITYSIEVKNPPNFEWNDVESGLTGLSHTLKDIHPDVDYMFRIRAHNEFGSSEATLPVSLYRPIEVEQYYDDEYDSDYEVPFVTLGDCVPPKLPMETPRLTSVTGERAMLHWLSARIPAYAKKVPITYIVEIKEDNMPGFSHFQSGIIDPKFLIEGLNPNMGYQFRVKAETQFGCSDPTLAVCLDRNKEEEESELKLEDVRNLIQTMQDKVKRPLIDLKREDLEIPQAKMRDAAPKGVPPRMSSSRPLITNHYGGNLLLTWGPARVPSYVKGSSLKYTVEKREPPHSMWTILADNIEDNEYDVTGLNPERDYMFRIRAKNQFGASDPTMPCSVINVRDDYVPPVFSRSQSRDSGTPRMSRRSSIESPLVLSRQISLDESDDMYRSGMPPEFKSTVEELQYGVLGKTARINLAVRGFPLPVVEWTFKGDNLSDKTKYKSIITPSGVITLDIFNLCLDDIGEYKCTAENDNGIKIIIVQLEYADAPTFIEPTEDMYLDSHKSGRFECKVDGIPYPKIRWMKDTRPITETSRLKIQHTKPNQWSLSLNDVISLDSGLYTCVAENVAGKSISSSNLFVDDDSDNEELETTTKQISFRESAFEDYYYPLEELGRGRHGIVRRVIQKSTGKEYAAKMIPACNEELKFFFGHELNNMRRINNQRVPSVIDAFQSERQLVIVMELVKGRSLVDHILSQDKWTEIEAVKYVKQLLEILRNIHASSIAHLDIKPSNIFLSSPDSDQIRLIDFGLSRHMSMDYDVKLNYGTEEFTSPEQIKNETVSSASDMWSVGILTYILLSGVSPLRGENNSKTLKKVMEGKINPLEENFKHVSEDAIDFLAELLVVDPCDRLSAAECLIHPWIKESAEKSNSSLDLGPLVSFQTRDSSQRKASSLRSIAQLHCLTSVLEQTVPVTPFTTAKDNESGNQTYPDCEYFGEYLDEESWYDWQNRYHRGPGAKVVPLTDAEYLSRVPGLRTTRRMTDVDDEDVETIVRRKMSVMEADRDIHEDPCLRKELQYGVVADDVKQRKKASKDLFPKEDTKDENPQIVSKFHDLAFTPGENIVLRCILDIDESPAVTWYRNEELVSESSRIYVKVTDNGTVLTVVSAKPYDAGIYKCIVRSKGGKATAAARVLVGDVPSQPSRPVATQVSSTQALLLWEPPTTNGNSYITGYRVDCRKTNGNSWLTVAHPIDECTIVKDLAPNASYRFRVCAVNQFGFSAYSVASPEIVTTEDGDKIVLDEYTSAILARQSGVHLMSSPPSSGPVQLTEGAFSEKYNLTETVYSGKFSEIKIAENTSTKRSYAAKIIPCDKDKNTTEFEILKLMNHEKVIRLYDGFLFSEKLYIITEYLCGVNVLQHFAFKSKYSEDMVAIVIRQILEGVQYLHHMGVVHLNLQPSSVVMRSRRHLDVKICGFSHARKLSGNGEVVPCEGYPDFIAPEIVTRKTTSYSADTWTVGVLSFLLLSGDSPFRASSVEETYFNIAYSRYDAHSLYDNITRDALRFMNRIMKRIPSNRVSVEDCLEDKWLLVADTTVKARQEAIFTTAKLRSFADLYRERGILGIWMPEDIPETETESDENTDKKEKKTEVPTKTETEQTLEAKENIETAKPKDDNQVISQKDSNPVTTQKGDDIVESQQNVIDKVAETVVTDAMEDAFKSKELN